MTDIANSGAPDTPIPQLALNIDDACVAAGTNRSRIYRAIRDKELIARKAGRSTIILVEDLTAWLRSLPAMGQPPQIGDAA